MILSVETNHLVLKQLKDGHGCCIVTEEQEAAVESFLKEHGKILQYFEGSKRSERLIAFFDPPFSENEL